MRHDEHQRQAWWFVATLIAAFLTFPFFTWTFGPWLGAAGFVVLMAISAWGYALYRNDRLGAGAKRLAGSPAGRWLSWAMFGVLVIAVAAAVLRLQ
jgi:hypothetical protein